MKSSVARAAKTQLQAEPRKNFSRHDIDQIEMVHAVCMRHQAVWTGRRGIAGLIGEVSRLLEGVDRALVILCEDSGKAVESKSRLREGLIVKAQDMAEALYPRARETGDDSLLMITVKPASWFRRLGDTTLFTTCSYLCDEAEQGFNRNSDQGIRKEAIDSLRGQINLYAASLTDLSDARKKQGLAEMVVRRNIKTLKKLLEKRLDGQVERFRGSPGEFYREYHRVRKNIQV